MKVVVVGASDKPERYSHRALTQLVDRGHDVIPVHPRLEEIENIKVAKDLASIKDDVHTVTMYVGEDRSNGMLDDLVALNPQRVIFLTLFLQAMQTFKPWLPLLSMPLSLLYPLLLLSHNQGFSI